ncbi:MAG: bifunctional diguanylate cyclase/phosphodiesterase [Cellvibrionaceae bacterium]
MQPGSNTDKNTNNKPTEALSTELSELKKNFEALLTYAVDAMVRVDTVPPIDIRNPRDQIIEHLVEHNYIGLCNDTFAQSYGYKHHKEVVGMNAKDLVGEDGYRERMTLYVDSGFAFDQALLQRPNREGKDVYGVYNAAAILEDEHNFCGLWASFTDVSAAIKQQEEFTQLAQRYRRFVSNSFYPMARIAVSPPMPMNLSPADQVAYLVKHMVYADVNDAYADWVSYQERSSSSFDDETVLVNPLEKQIFSTIVEAFVEQHCQLAPSEWHFVNADTGRTFRFNANCQGMVESDHLVEIWASFRDTSVEAQYLQEIEYQARHDLLTGLPNRKKLYEALEEYLKIEKPFTLMLIDLDLFKEINDNLGHHSGDLLLQKLGPRLKDLLDGLNMEGIVARLGGDEFAIAVCGTFTPVETKVLANKTSATINKAADLDGVIVHIGSSIGICAYPDNAIDVQGLMRSADTAMYRSKKERQPFAVFTPEKDQQDSRQLRLMSELRMALENDHLSVHYQPKIDIKSRRIVGMEALLRWYHPTHGYIPPGEFIPAAETTNIIQTLTQFVLRRALLDCKSWQSLGKIPVAVNISGSNMTHAKFITFIESILRANNLPPAMLELELTESALMSNPDYVLMLLEKLKKLGVYLSIDDFGTGYSSLAYLRNFPVDILKVDFTFVRNMLSNPQDRIIVDSVIKLGHNLGLEVVAEGVENVEILNELQTLGCDKAQGYYFEKAMDIDELLIWIKDYNQKLFSIG